jgi:hypothetical protein
MRGAYIEVPPIVVNILLWVACMLWALFVFLSNVGGDSLGDLLMAFTGLAFLAIDTAVALFWINARFNLVTLKT